MSTYLGEAPERSEWSLALVPCYVLHFLIPLLVENFSNHILLGFNDSQCELLIFKELYLSEFLATECEQPTLIRSFSELIFIH